MDYAYRMYKNVKWYYEQINPATLSGAIDVIVVEQPNGDLLSTPFHVRFGKYGVFNYKEKYVDISINGHEVKNLRMKLGDNGIAFFVEETVDNCVPDFMVTSPVPGEKHPPIDKILAETSATLKRHLENSPGQSSSAISSPMSSARQRDQSPIMGGASPCLSDVATSPSSTMRRSKSMVRGKEAESIRDITERTVAEAEDSNSPLRRKLTLAYSSSVFSQRKNRSLPNLSNFGTGIDAEHTIPLELTNLNQPSLTAVTTPTTAAAPPSTPHKTPNRRTRGLRQVKSQALDKRAMAEMASKRDKNRESSTSSIDSLPSSPSKKKGEASPSPSGSPATQTSGSCISVKGLQSFTDLKGAAAPARKSTSSLPIDIQIQADDDTSSSASSSSRSSPMGAPVDSAEAARIAEGALSDTEVDRHKREGGAQEHGSDVAVWNWGQFPKTRDQQKQEEPVKPKTSSSYWANWWWRSNNNNDKKGNTTPSTEEADGGIYLDDLMKTTESDPRKIEKYLGKQGTHSSKSTDADSGTGSGLTTSPSSPSGQSNHEEAPLEDRTPTQENFASALNKATTPIDRPSSAGSTTPTTSKKERAHSEIFPMSEDEDVTQEEDLETAIEGGRKFIRSLRLSSERLKSLGLQAGANECRFAITTKFQGTSWCACNIYMYKYNEKIVISDIDGTITKSDVLGHVIPAIGGQWAHAGVAELYTRIKANGYKLVYLSSRAIGQAATTKNYLKTVQQDSRVLPDGPVLLAPDSVLVAFRREVIERRPEEFKIAALSDLKKLFPTKGPFFAGFGNRDTDVKSYCAVGIDSSRILIIDPSGIVRRADSYGYKSSYKCMAQDSVDCIFPPIIDERARKKPHLTRLSFSRPQSSSAYTYWTSRDYTNVSDDELKKYEAKRTTTKKKK